MKNLLILNYPYDSKEYFIKNVAKSLKNKIEEFSTTSKIVVKIDRSLDIRHVVVNYDNVHTQQMYEFFRTLEEIKIIDFEFGV